jgi:hypothetical protein
MRTNSGQIERRDMAQWSPHPTRANIFINQDDGLLYEECRGWYNMVFPQRMTEDQELESFRRADGVVRMTSRSRGRTNPPADPVPGEVHT